MDKQAQGELTEVMQQSRLTTRIDMVKATQEKYIGATGLSKREFKVSVNNMQCLYSHDANGIGCAIGCHLTDEKASQLQSWGEQMVVQTAYGSVPEFRELINEVIDVEAVGLDFLRTLQKAHDGADCLETFQARLERYLELGTFFITGQ